MIMSTMVLASAVLALGLATSSVALAAMPAGFGQVGGVARLEQSANGVEAIRWHRHQNRNGFRFFFRQHRDCSNVRSQFDFERCSMRHRRHGHPGIFFNSGGPFGSGPADPDFGFSIGF
jgi:hypothetical protein